MEEKVTQEFRERTVESFLDLLILTTLTENRSMSADDLMDFIHQELKVSLSSGLVYSHLFHLEQDKLIHRDYNKNRKVFGITQKGKEQIDIAKKHKSATLWVIGRIFEE